MTGSALPDVALASDLPRRTTGTRVRSGNAMSRTRVAVLDAAAHCVERYGVRRTTMGDIALKAAVAKGTLYNHFRTKDDVLAALVASRVDALRAACLEAVRTAAGDDGLVAALRTAAAELASSGPLRRVVADDPGLASRVATPGTGRGGAAARDAVREVLAATGADDGDAAVELVLRWLVSQVFWPAQGPGAAEAVERLAAALRRPESG